MARRAAPAIPALEDIGIVPDRLTPRAAAVGRLEDREAEAIPFRLRDALDPFRQAVKNPPPVGPTDIEAPGGIDRP